MSVCPSCRAPDSLQYLAQIFSQACIYCGHVDDAVHFYDAAQPPDNYDAPSAPVGANLAGGGNAPDAYHTLADNASALAASALFRRLASGARLLEPELTRQEKRQLTDRAQRPAISRLVQGTLARIGFPNFAERADALFDQARTAAQQRHDTYRSLADHCDSRHVSDGGDDDDSDRTTRDPSLVAAQRYSGLIRWGASAEAMAAACCYAVLRREARIVDLQTVAAAALQPLARVQRSLRHLKFLASGNLGDVDFHHVDAIIVRIVGFFEHEMRLDGGKALHGSLSKFLAPYELRPTREARYAVATLTQTPPRRTLHGRPRFADVERLALELGNLWWRHRSPGISLVPAAFAIVVLALEATSKRTLMLDIVSRYLSTAAEGPRTVDDVDGDACIYGEGGSIEDETKHASVGLRYRELLGMLQSMARQMAWMTTQPTGVRCRRAGAKTAKGDGTAKRSKPGAAGELSKQERSELVCHVVDLIGFVSDGRSGLGAGLAGAVSGAESGQARQGRATREVSEADGRGVADASARIAGRGRQDADDDSSREADQTDAGVGAEEGRRRGEAAWTVEGKRGEATAVGASRAARQRLMAAMERLESGEDRRGREGGDVYSRRRAAIEAVLASRLGAAATGGHVLDLLEDEEVDKVLFEEKEMEQLIRTQEEVEKR
ncbi:hypothetical protein ACQY0O_005673 [Thecaphora frezii]